MSTTLAPTPAIGMVCSLPAAIRVRQLRDARQSERLIRLRARLTRDQFRRARNAHLIGWDVAARILALPIPLGDDPDARVPTTGTRRRVQALVAAGWPPDVLAAALEVDTGTVGWLLNPNIRATTRAQRRAVCALYDQRWDWRPEDHGVPAEDAADTRAVGRMKRYAPALAWDDDSIELPLTRARHLAAVQVVALDMAAIMRALEGERVPLTGFAHSAAIEYGARHRGLDWSGIADALGMEYDSVKKAWERIKARAREDGETWPDSARWTTDAREMGHEARKGMLR